MITGSAEIICVGTELLLGDILNSNAQYLAKQLAHLGISHHYQTVVGDNPLRLARAIAIACERSRLIIFTGGLGPTPDDITTATIADFFGVPLVENVEVLADIKAKFAQRDRVMTDNNRKQAWLPEGADILPNTQGTAPGILWQPRPGLHIMTFPGVPRELYSMWQTTAVPYLQDQGWSNGIIHSRTLKFWGTSESGLAAKVNDFLQLENPTVAPYASDGVIKLRISAKADSLNAAEQLIDPVAKQLKAIGGVDCFGEDDETLGNAVGRLLIEQAATLAVAESCTGGGLGAMVTAVPGSSQYFMGGIISYDNTVKERLLGVSPQDLVTHGAVSAPVAEQMAGGVRARLRTDWGISITGIAGPGGGSPQKPVGLVFIGVANQTTTWHIECRFGHRKSREWIRLMSRNTALDILRRTLLSNPQTV
ncbi:competence/damage-inducible protein A [Leptolyngbyaceae cyanobacterium CCMR0082]|uniref:CinA-like protein n=1 Tax=Adonisia turfae CCMR0082 TaxID=2304604 RepID=A0A6M0S4R6_9CYAN|nr:competence/damage-inducible protein A [Adonisia turfae]MDV3351792.1 competence/damage-inducible protein A [Leptothoe sp. LEGE 181152]NEZ62961.1 competence/damage-inducible protein A [Adonisia turfae CCMR0082]